MSKQSYAGRKGADAEIKLAAWLKDHVPGRVVFRVVPNGARDLGDVHVTDPSGAVDVIEVKNVRQLSIGAALAERDREALNVAQTGTQGPIRAFLVVRPYGVTDPARWWVVQRVEDVWG